MAISSSRRCFSSLFAQAVELAGENQVLVHGQLVVERKLLRHVADHFLDLVAFARDVEAGDSRRAFRRFENAAKHADDGGFAGAVRPEKSEDRTARDGEADVIDGRESAEAFRQPLALDHCVAHGSESIRKTSRSGGLQTAGFVGSAVCKPPLLEAFIVFHVREEDVG